MHAILSTFEVKRDRKARVQRQIEAFLEAHIRSGCLPPGARFPTTPELAELWHVNLVAVHRAMTALKHKGLVERKARLGTRVLQGTARCRIGIMMGPDLGRPSAQYYRAFTAALQQGMAARGWDQTLHQDVSARVRNEEDARALLVSTANEDIHGLIAIGMLPKTVERLVQAADVPAVRCIQNLHFADVANDMYHFGYEVVEYLARQGCRRVVFLGSFPGSASMQGVQDAMAEYEDILPEVHATQPKRGVSREEQVADTVRHMLQVCSKRNPLPDALVVADDVAMQRVTEVLSASQKQGVRDVRLVCSANEGVPLATELPVIRYEFPVQGKADVALDILEKRLHGDEPQRLPVMQRGAIVLPGSADL